MNKLESLTEKQYIFGALFVVANRIDTLMEREFKKFGVTTKQWFLSIIIDNLFVSPPTIKDVSREMGSSHQNVKQLALKLAQKGLLALEKDKKDSRVTRLKLTEQSFDFWKKLRTEGSVFTQGLFKDISHEELDVTRSVMKRMLLNINDMDRKDEEAFAR